MCKLTAEIARDFKSGSDRRAKPRKLMKFEGIFGMPSPLPTGTRVHVVSARSSTKMIFAAKA